MTIFTGTRNDNIPSKEIEDNAIECEQVVHQEQCEGLPCDCGAEERLIKLPDKYI